MWWQIGGTAVAVAVVLAAIESSRRSIIMAVGTESAKALAEVKDAIAVEVDQAATKIADAVGADADTAAAIRELLAPVKGIIPDDVDAGDGSAPDPAGEVVTDEQTL